MTIEERFENLEKQNRGLRRLSLASIAIALAALVGGTALAVRASTAAIEPISITTHAIAVKDGAGKKRLVLDGLNGSLGSYDANGKLRAFVNSNGIIFLQDENGKVRVHLSPGGDVNILDYNGVSRVFLTSSDNRIYFRNASNKVVAAYP